MTRTGITAELTTVRAEVARTAAGYETRAFFGLAGSGNFMLIHELRGAGLDYYAATHEAACVAMADGYSRAGGVIGIATVHQGPGLTNAATALREAVRSHSSLVLFAADVPTGNRDHNQYVDQVALASSLGAGVETVHAPEAPVDTVARAFRRTADERRPIVVMLPTDVQEQPVRRLHLDRRLTLLPQAPAPAEAALSEAAGLISSAERPVILAGAGAARSHAGEAIGALAEHLGAPLLTTTRAHSLFQAHRRNLGLAGGFGSENARATLRRADLLLVFGASLNAWSTAYDDDLAGRAQIIQVDIDAQVFSGPHPIAVPILGDCAATAVTLRSLTNPGRGRAWSAVDENAVGRGGDGRRREPPRAGDGDAVDPRELTAAFDVLLPIERTISIDSGHFMIFPASAMRAPDPAGFLLAQAFMSMGLALYEALGAAVVRPDRLAVAMLGDGRAKMSLCELDTAVRHGLPVLVVIFNDAAYGAEVHDFADSGYPLDIVRFSDVDFAALARAFGARGITVRSLDDLAPLNNWLAEPDRPMVLDAKVDPSVRGDWTG